MRRIILLIQTFVIFLGTLSCGQDISKRNKIAFEDDIQVVADSIAKMDALMYKLPENRRINYFIDKEGNLFINNEEIGSLKGAINNERVRRDEAFDNFTDEEINQFFNLMAYLLQNHIDGAVMELSVREFVFTYRRTAENRYDDVREVILIDNQSDTSLFENTYQILDSKNSLALVAPKDARIR